jgi:hypothetical protein
VAAAGGSATENVTASAGCAWTVGTVPAWITIASGSSGSGNGTVTFSVAANSGALRSASLTVSGQQFTISQLAPATLGGARFVPVTPCRIVDTRNAAATFGGPSIAAGTSRDFPIPSSPCGIPSNATAYALNVTVVPHGALGYLTVWPAGQTQPFVSTLNSADGRVKANAAIVPAGTGGSVSIYATNTTDVIIDINGYFVSSTGSGTMQFYPVTPCRVIDTRSAAGPLGAPIMGAGQTRNFPILSGACSIPSSATAYSFSITVAPVGPLGYLTTWATGSTQPVVSTLNALTGVVTANAALVPAGTGGSIAIYATNQTDVFVDINGYFAPVGGAGALSFYAATPCRVVDTRNANGAFGGPILSANTTRNFTISQSSCGIPSSAVAFSLNATVVPSAALTYMSLWPAGPALSPVGTLSAPDGAITGDAAIVSAGTQGAIGAFATDSTHLILDINGYFAP